MTDYLVMRLVAPIASFGGPAGYEYRGTDRVPSRSAILGLIGGAMGIRRDDTAGQGALRDLGVAVAVYGLGAQFRDFHTVQSVPKAAMKNPRSRRHALSQSDDLQTTLTRRDYVTDAFIAAAVWQNGAGAPDLKQVQSALIQPIFVPYLGRKSCPLAAPINPQIVDAAHPKDVLTAVNFGIATAPQTPELIVSDMGGGETSVEWRNDDPTDRGAWHFARRKAYVYTEQGQGT